MNTFKQTLLTFLAVISLSVLGSRVQAQQSNSDGYRAAVQDYNKANKLAKNKQYAQAIDAYKKAISKAQGGGQKSSKLIKLSKKQLPALYYREAFNAYSTFQKSQTVGNLDNTIQAFKKAVNAGNQYGSQSIVSKANDKITRLMYMKSVLQYSNKNYADALKTANKTINRNANYADAYYQKALILKKQNKMDDAYSAFDNAIKVGKKTGNSTIVSKAQQNASGTLVYQGAQEIKNKHYSSAITMLKRAINKYNPKEADAYYRLASAYNHLGKYNEALNYAKKGLNIETGGRAAKAEYYYEEGKAYQGLNKKSSACKAFANALYGDFKNSSHHIMKYELKCKQTQSN
ncbi:MAG TPA: tetratricopeptide repeat protein [Balneolaceae bacterium]|nr:tetratricopeptide repeat protein [Balneolaceae bacterium]